MPRKSFAQKSKELLRKVKPEKLDKLDRFRAFFVDHIQLTPQEEEQLVKYRQAFSIYCNDNSKAFTLTQIRNELNVSESQSYVILKDAIKLFGDVLKADKHGERAASREHYIRIAKAAEQAGDYEIAYKARVQADKIMGLYESDEAKIPSSILLPPTTFVFVTDPEVLKQQQTEDTDFEIEQ